jgi:hypothetical protein
MRIGADGKSIGAIATPPHAFRSWRSPFAEDSGNMGREVRQGAVGLVIDRDYL